MQTVLNAPVASLGVEKLLDGKLFTRIARDQPNGFRLTVLAAYRGVQTDLCGSGKADLFGSGLLCAQATAFITAAVDFLSLDRLTYAGGLVPRGKKPPYSGGW
jgi:hypothetical protein